MTATFGPKSEDSLAYLCDNTNGLLSNLASLLGVDISVDDGKANITGHDALIAKDILTRLEPKIEQGITIRADDVMSLMESYRPAKPSDVLPPKARPSDLMIKAGNKTVGPSSPGQEPYVKNLLSKDMVFGLGPAGSGKTYLAVAVAVSLLKQGVVERIVLSRPAVEAGEKLGYLPGDMKDKVDPYMQPLYDALSEFLGGSALAKLMEKKTIEICPLAFMRGRTLKNSYILLDEAQNATAMQMKMFLTRLGDGSKMAIVGDHTQNDLPRGVKSGLEDAVEKLKDIPAIGISRMTAQDVVRHPLVKAIVEAYEAK